MPLPVYDAAKTPADNVSIGTSNATVLAANANRRVAFISNDHASNVLYLSLGGTAVASKGIRVAPGAVLVLESYTGAINGIASGASTTVCISEV